jgi:hypothetical protein
MASIQVRDRRVMFTSDVLVFHAVVCLMNVLTRWLFSCSISSSPNEIMTTHHIKVRGSSSSSTSKPFDDSKEWTETLYDLVSAYKSLPPEAISKLVVNIDGPYGGMIPIERYRRILLVAGGIGMTPIISIYRHMFLSRYDSDRWYYAHIKDIRLIWIVRNLSDLLIFEPLLRHLQQLQSNDSGNIGSNVFPKFSYVIYVTQAEQMSITAPISRSNSLSSSRNQDLLAEENISIDHETIFKGRPDLFLEMQVLEVEGEEGLVYVSGPTSLVERSRETSRKLRLSFMSETFAF